MRMHHHTGTAAAQPADGHQSVTGTITKVKQSAGTLTVRSSNGTLKLHFPPEAVRGLKKGDAITVQYAFTTAANPEGTTRSYDMPKGSGEHQMTGTVSRVNDRTGWMSVKTDHGTLQLRFSAGQLEHVKSGDRVTVDLAFSRAS